jgi:hypothetical protein
MELSDREESLLCTMLAEYKKSVLRKRSWRASEKAVSMADAERLVKKILGSDKDAVSRT